MKVSSVLQCREMMHRYMGDICGGEEMVLTAGDDVGWIDTLVPSVFSPGTDQPHLSTRSSSLLLIIFKS
jgi:hypothetical protein